jgi:hypothetical protein
MPRNRITEKGRNRQGRGRGHGSDYLGWALGTDFPAPTGFTRIPLPGVDRSAGLFPPHERVLLYELIWRQQSIGDIMEIREQYPLPLAATLEICDRLKIPHPFNNKNKEWTLLSVDIRVDAFTATGDLYYEVYDVVTELTLNTDPREVELLDVRRAYFAEEGVTHFIKTEHQLDPVLASNVGRVMRGMSPADYWTFDSEDLDASEQELYLLLKRSDLPFRFVSRQWDQRLGLSPGSTLTMIWCYIWHQIWRVDMSKPIQPDKAPLALLERKGLA